LYHKINKILTVLQLPKTASENKIILIVASEQVLDTGGQSEYSTRCD